MPPFVPPQLCRLLDRPPAGADWAHEIKFDGYRIQMRVESGACSLRTRKGLDWSDKFPEIAQAGEKLPDCMIDGEIVALDDAGRPTFNLLQNFVGEAGRIRYFIFDVLHHKGRDLTGIPLVERRKVLGSLKINNARIKVSETVEVESSAQDGRTWPLTCESVPALP